ncbi:hypothetical protein [Candidatus Clostridium radicumherbarum]|uniref:DUF4956 domain-containing protein n=1 Tax=Candidatus Clostridium radicumherbarum TaxID=3381662 RepID=A0ABW8TS62_9CLOT
MGSMDESVSLNNVVEINQEVIQTTGKKLWNPKGFLILSILFSFLPAAILYSLNYGRLGFSKKKNISLLISIIAFAIMISMALLINLSILKGIFYGLNIGAAVYMRQDQSKLFENHVLNGGRKASYLVPVLVSTVITAIFLVLMFYSINIPDQKLMFNGSELYFTENVQKSDAEKLGTYLSEQGFFNENRKVSVKIDKKSTTYEFSLIIDKSSLEDKNLEQSAKDMSTELSKNVFNNNKVNINLCDNVFKPLKTISN